MFSADTLNIFQWWLTIFAVGLVFFPAASFIFSSFIDSGYIFAKILGLLAVSYTAWLLGSFSLLPFTSFSVTLILGLFALLNFILILQNRFSFDRSKLKYFLFEELLFSFGLSFWAVIRANEPSIHGLEKYMDFGFINSILRSNFFPPLDLWMPPLSINYYYFGHLTAAVLIKLSGLVPSIAYNLMVASLFGLTLTASFSIGVNLYDKFNPDRIKTKFKVLAGLISAFLVTLGGNLHTVYLFFKNYPNPENPLPFWQLPFGLNFSGYWYPNATRFIPFTIHEFPLYSFVVSDLHGHVLNIPFVLLLVALLMKIFFQNKLLLLDFLLLSLLIAVSLMTNVLDGPIYLLVILAVLLARQLEHSKLDQALLKSLKSLILIAGFAAVLSLPFWLSFKPFSSGIGVLCAPDFLTSLGRFGPFLFETNHCARSPLWMLAILWGFPYFILSGFLFFVLDIKKLFRNSKLEIRNSVDLLILILVLVATTLLILPEIFYVKDIYPAHYRANTVFKFGYQAFIILGLASGYMIVRLISGLKSQISKMPYTIFLIFAFLFLTLVLIYPYFAINSYYNGLKSYQRLDGLSYLAPLYPDDYRAILWLQQNISGQPVILEAQGDSYTDFARVSSNTGLPTVIGWPVHEWLWRGSYDEAGKRSAEAAELYESSDSDLTKQLIQKYKIEYIFIGSLERQKYLKLNEDKFSSLGKIIFQSGNTKIYQILDY